MNRTSAVEVSIQAVLPVSREVMASPSQRVGAGLAGPDAHGLEELEHEDLPVADLPGLGRARDRLDDAGQLRVVDGDLDLHLRHEVDLVLRAPVDLRVALLPAV